MNNDAKQEILDALNKGTRYLHESKKNGGLIQFSYTECYMEAILWMLEVLGYDYCMKNDEKLGHIVYTDIVENPDR